MRIIKNVLYTFTLLSYTILNAQMVQNTLSLPMSTGDSTVPHDKPYYKHYVKESDVEIIYTEENIPFAKRTANIGEPLHNDYQDLYKWELDETLHVGLISDCNQIANGYSTQFPTNRQINYIGGTIALDHFANTSWLDILLYHETAHNYQINAKKRKFSQITKTVFGTGSVLVPLPVATPNLLVQSFMLEGNAVLNESWHGSGGRLYNGRLKAMSILQAKAGNIQSKYMYNDTLKFPYNGDNWYHIGGFYNLYLAQIYGLKNTNSFFYDYSGYWWWPFMTNNSMKRAVGVSFESSLNEFASTYTQMADNFVMAKGKHLLSSQSFSPMSSDDNEIFFLSNETRVRANELIVMNKKDISIKRKRDSWLQSSGKVLKVDNEYFVQGSKHTSPIKITQGLFDNDGFIKEATDGKMLQGYLNDGREVYFDVASSFDQARLFVGNEYYTITNSSVVINHNDIYYFKNKDKTKERTLYKNKTPLYTYQGFFGVVTDVDSSGAVYFVANSDLGSSLYKHQNNKVTRVSEADNIYDAKLINDKEVLITAISDKDYYYVINNLTNIDEEPYETKFFFEDKEYYGHYKNMHKHEEIDTSNPYTPLFNMKYSGTDVSLGVSETSVIFNINADFSDSLTQNSANIFISRDESNVTIAGLGYANSQYLLNYSILGYGVVDDYNRNNTRDAGIIASANLPFYKAGYYSANAGATFFQDYDTLEREPLSGYISLSRAERYGHSMFMNYYQGLNLYGVKERDDTITGASYSYIHDLPYEFYVGLSAKYSTTDADISDATANIDTRGVKISKLSYTTDMDISTIYMPTVENSIYVKSAGYAEVALYKVLNFSSYWFTFPFSLQREAVYAKYKYYNVEAFNQAIEKLDVNEVNIGLRLDVIAFNKLGPIAITTDYFYNDNDKFTKDAHKVRFSLGIAF